MSRPSAPVTPTWIGGKIVRKLLTISLTAFGMAVTLLFSWWAVAGAGEAAGHGEFISSALIKAQELQDNVHKEIGKLTAEIRKNEEILRRSEELAGRARQQGNMKAQMIAQDALTKAGEAIRKNKVSLSRANNKAEALNRAIEMLKTRTAHDSPPDTIEEHYTVHRSTGTYKNGNSLIIINQTKEKTEETPEPPPSTEPGIAAIDCKEALKYLKRNDCYCTQSNRPPLCGGADAHKGDAQEKTYVFYWQAETGPSINEKLSKKELKMYRTSGFKGHKITDGTYFGRHSSYDEAFNACRQAAKNAIAEDAVTNVLCTPTFAGGQSIF